MAFAQLDRLALALVVAITAVVALRVLVGGVLALAGLLPGALGNACRAASDRVTPAVVRRAAAVLIAGGALGPVALAGSAGASTTTDVPASPGTGDVTAADPLDRGSTPAVRGLRAGSPDPLDRGAAPRVRTTRPTQANPPSSRPAPPSSGPAPSRHHPRGAAVIVRAGDSLWSIAARELGAGASQDAVARRWPEWYAANRDVIGPDPSLLLPGQRLVPP